jgi:4'-phosphopantetheinyl transferase
MMRNPVQADFAAGEALLLWRIALDQPAASCRALEAVLSADERARAARFARPELGDRYVVGRAGLRLLLADQLDAEPERLRFVYGEHGKPALAGVEGLAFNLSHSADLAIVGMVRNAEIGVDVEAIRRLRDRDRLARRTFTAAENAALQALPPDARDAGFFACWTRKEAVVKTTGIGFSFELDWFEVPVDPALEAIEVAVRGPRAVSGRYALRTLAAAPGFAAAVAVRRPGRSPARGLHVCLRTFVPG